MSSRPQKKLQYYHKVDLKVQELLEEAKARAAAGAAPRDFTTNVHLVDIVECQSLFFPEQPKYLRVEISNAAPGGKLQQWITTELRARGFADVEVQTEW